MKSKDFLNKFQKGMISKKRNPKKTCTECANMANFKDSKDGSCFIENLNIKMTANKSK